jgi:isopenicillin-N N-acyltransferase-like protein
MAFSLFHFLFVCCVTPRLARSARSAPPRTLTDMLRCTGSPFETGRTHGAALAPQIHRTLAALDASRAARGPAGSIAAFLYATQHRDAMRAHTPELLEEINGIAAGAGANVDDVLCMSLMDEEWTFARDLHYATQTCAAQAATASVGAAPGCTVIAQTSASGPAVISQTMDLSPALAGAQAVIHIAHTAPAVGTSNSSASLGATIATAAGMLGLFGVNAAGVGCVVNNLATLPTSPRGLPVAAVIRGLLARSRCVADAVAFLHLVPHATGQAYTIGDASGVVQCWEADADGVAQVPIAAAAVAPAAADETAVTTLLHGNHPLVRASRWSDDAQVRTYAANTTHERCASVRSAFARSELPSAGESVAACMVRMQAALSHAPVSITIADGAARGCFTFCAATMLCAAPPQIHLAAGPPCSVPFLSIEPADAALVADAAAQAALANANPEFTFGIIADTQYVNAADGSNFDGSVVRRHRQSLTILAQAQRSFRAMCAAAPADGTPALAAAAVSSADPLPTAQTMHNFKCAVLLGDVLDGRAKDTALACVADVRRITDSEDDSALDDDGTGEACSSASSSGSGGGDTALADHCPRVRVRVPWHFCVGNHDLTALSRDDVLAHLLTDEAKSRCAADRLYYDFAPRAGFRFVFLDAFDVRCAHTG